MGSDRVRANRKSSSTLTPGFKPKQFSFLQPRYQDQVEAETDSVQENKRQNSSEQPNLTSALSHSFGRVSVLPIQTKLTIGQPGNKYEQEADRVAAQVVQQVNSPQAQQSGNVQRDTVHPEKDETIQSKPVISTLQRETMPEEEEEEELQAKPISEKIQRQEMPEEEEEEEELQAKPIAERIQRQEMPEEEEELQAKPIADRLQRQEMPAEDEELVQTKTEPSAPLRSNRLAARLEQSKGGGRALPGIVQAEMGRAFGADFSGVKVYTDREAVQMNRQLGAQAFTHGRDVYFNAGKYQPETGSGQHLLAHELTHVLQQNQEIRMQGAATAPAPKPKTPKQKALDLVTAFAAEKSSPQAFSKLSKAAIVAGLKARIANPDIIDQNQLKVCGPAAVMYIYASSNPEAYAKMTIDLFKFGKASGSNYTVKPGSDLKGKGPSNYTWSGTPPEEVDWMVLSSMRDSANAVLDFEGSPEENAAGITMPGEMDKWLQNLMGMGTVEDETNLYLTKGLGHLDRVNDKFKNGYTVILFINANMLSNKSKKAAKKSVKSGKNKGGKIQAAFPNHYVVLRSKIVKGGKIKFTIWTWGSIRSYQVDKEAFEDNYYGAIFTKK